MTIVSTDLARTLSPSARELIDGLTNWIDGKWEDGESAQTLTVVNPSTTEEIRTVASASTAQTEGAVLAARRAFDTETWADASPRERSDVLGRAMGDDGFREFFQVKHIQWPIR
jgi:delta 1-pyrroline-5-carboxylate dehydrogenase